MKPVPLSEAELVYILLALVNYENYTTNETIRRELQALRQKIREARGD